MRKTSVRLGWSRNRKGFTIAAQTDIENAQLMAQVLERHIREHVIDPGRKATRGQIDAADELVDVVKAYLK